MAPWSWSRAYGDTEQCMLANLLPSCTVTTHWKTWRQLSMPLARRAAETPLGRLIITTSNELFRLLKTKILRSASWTSCQCCLATAAAPSCCGDSASASWQGCRCGMVTAAAPCSSRGPAPANWQHLKRLCRHHGATAAALANVADASSHMSERCRCHQRICSSWLHRKGSQPSHRHIRHLVCCLHLHAT
jgi:hypothetical protein